MLDIYDVSKDYIEYLKTIESKIPNISYNQRDKFICGIVMVEQNFKYFVPVSSFNKQQKTNYLILNANNQPVGSLRFSFMFPLPDGVAKRKIIANESDIQYKRLLQEEWNYITTPKNEQAILRKAKAVYKMGCDINDPYFKNCCDFKNLENKISMSGYINFLNQKTITAIQTVKNNPEQAKGLKFYNSDGAAFQVYTYNPSGRGAVIFADKEGNVYMGKDFPPKDNIDKYPESKAVNKVGQGTAALQQAIKNLSKEASSKLQELINNLPSNEKTNEKIKENIKEFNFSKNI